MKVEEFIAQLKLAKNKQSEVIFKIDNRIIKTVVLTEVIETPEGTIKHPALGEVSNAIAVLLSDTVKTNE